MAMKLERILLGNSTAAGPSRLRVMKVDVTSDFTCPFCLLAVKQLQLAVAKYNTIHFHETLELRFRFLPYQLNPTLGEDPVSRMDHWRKKFGPQKADAVRGTIEDKLRTVGYEICEVSSTHLAHRLMTYALRNDPAAQLPLAMNLFEAHHLDGQHLSDREFLTYQAMLFNLFPTGAHARQWLDGDECDAEVRRAYASAHRLGVTGVPFFVFQQKYAASGAAGIDEFVKLLEDISRREDLSPASSSSPSPTSTLGTSILGGHPSSDKHRNGTHIKHHHGPPFPHQHQLPPINGSKHRHHPYPYRSRSPGSESHPRLPSPLGPGVYKNPSPTHAYPPVEAVVGYPYNSSKSPASTGYGGTSPGVSAERSTAGAGV